MRGKAWFLAGCLAALSALGGAATASAAPPPAAALDPSFGQEGRAFVALPKPKDSYSRSPVAAALGADGSVFLAREETVERLGDDGQVDQAFGQGGEVKVSAPSGDSFEIAGLAVDSQGRVIVAGTSFHESEQRPLSTIYGFELNERIPTAARIVRLLPNGEPDPGFGEGGAVETVFGLPAPPPEEGDPSLPSAEVTVTGVAIAADDGVVLTGGSVTGRAYPCSGGIRSSLQSRLIYAAYVARLTSNGSPESDFDGSGIFGGRSVAENPLHIGTATEPAVGADGSITYGTGDERCRNSKLPATPGLARLTASGEWQPGFGKEDGIRGGFWQWVPAPGGSLAAVGLTRWRESEPMRVRAFRAGPTGLPDGSFGKKGTSLVTLRGPALAFSATIGLDPQGRVLLADSQVKGGWRGFALFRLRPDGTIERNFAPGGRLAIGVPELYGPTRLLLDPQGRALLVGESRGARGEGIVVARLDFSR
jgi:uncharacterized delta-60 repeat protein